MLADLIELSRPKHWVKNVFVFLPVPFALASGARLDPLTFSLGLLGFCLGSSAVYAFNDAQDAERDKLHETKRSRPIPSGRVPKRIAYLWSSVLVAAGGALVLSWGGTQAMLIFCAYLLVNLAYSLGAKHIALLDVFLLSSYYLMRVLFGCALLEVVASNWLLLVSYALALFLALAKRRADLVKGVDDSHRPSLAGYDQQFLDHAMGICAGMTVVGYALYCMEAPVLIKGREFAGLPFVVFGVLDYLRMAHVKKAGGSPVDTLLTSPGLLLAGAGWLGATIWSVHFP